MIDTHDLFHLLHQRVRFVTKEFNQQLSAHGLYHSQWAIMYCLERFGPMTQTAIWKYLNVEAPTVTRTITRMENNDWVMRRQGGDKRERVVELTERAKKKYEQVNQAVYQYEQETISRLTPGEVDQFYSILQKLGPEGGEG